MISDRVTEIQGKVGYLIKQQKKEKVGSFTEAEIQVS